jgi:3-hydroxybutyrate dehydrogenase
MPGKVGARRDLRDKTALITGAAGGISYAFAQRFGQAGAKPGLLDLRAGGLETLSTGAGEMRPLDKSL